MQMGRRPNEDRSPLTTLVVTGSQPDAHDLPGHPEYAGRLQAVRRRLAADGLM